MSVSHLIFSSKYSGIRYPTYVPTGECASGYNGILCADCQTGYSRSGSFECQICPEKIANIIKIGAIMILFICLIIFMIRSTLKGAAEVRNITSVF